MSRLDELMISSLREEILLYGTQQLWIALFAVAMATSLSLVAHRKQLAWASILQVLVLVSATFAIARTDLLMHRAGAYIEIKEAGQADSHGGWERFKAAHPATKLVPVYDVLSVLIVLALFVDGQRRAWSALPTRWRFPFLVTTTVLQLVGFAAVPFAVLVSRSPG